MFWHSFDLSQSRVICDPMVCTQSSVHVAFDVISSMGTIDLNSNGMAIKRPPHNDNGYGWSEMVLCPE